MHRAKGYWLLSTIHQTQNTARKFRGEMTGLHLTAYFGVEAVVKLLLDTGKVDVDSKDEYGRTPLWIAAENGHEAVVKLLLDTGKVDADSKDNNGQTPLLIADKEGTRLSSSCCSIQARSMPTRRIKMVRRRYGGLL